MSVGAESNGGPRALRGVDTNVLVRYFAGDDIEHSAMARDLVARAEARGERLFVSLPVLCELLWVFARSRYRARREELVALVAGLLESPVFAIQDRPLVRRALEDFRLGRAELADYLIGRCCEAAGSSETLTFDEALLDHPHFEHPSDLVP